MGADLNARNPNYYILNGAGVRIVTSLAISFKDRRLHQKSGPDKVPLKDDVPLKKRRRQRKKIVV